MIAEAACDLAQTGAVRAREASRFSPVTFSNALIEEWLHTGERPDIMEEYFGAGDYGAIQTLLRDAARHPTADAPLVLILPGIMSSRLGQTIDSEFDDILWLDFESVTLGRLSELALSGPVNDVEPRGIVLGSYMVLTLRLRALGFEARFFAYDWRKGLDDLGASLARELQRLTPRRVHLVAHSMGAMVARAALKHNPANLGRIVILGPPNRGSFVPLQIVRGVHSVVKQLAALDPIHSEEALAREVFSTFPGLTELFPQDDNVDLFDPRFWPEAGIRPHKQELARARRVRAALPEYYDDLVLLAGTGQPTVTDARPGGSGFDYGVTTTGDSMIPSAFVSLPGAAVYYVGERHQRMPSNPLIATAVGEILRSGTTAMLGETWISETAPSRVVRERPPSTQRFKSHPVNDLDRILNGAASMSALEFL